MESLCYFTKFCNLFKDSLAKRADHQNITGSKLFPLKFCSTGWVESMRVGYRALKKCENLKIYLKNGKLPENFTANVILDAVGDSLMLVHKQ